jgi:hypothetical protein
VRVALGKRSLERILAFVECRLGVGTCSLIIPMNYNDPQLKRCMRKGCEGEGGVKLATKPA